MIPFLGVSLDSLRLSNIQVEESPLPPAAQPPSQRQSYSVRAPATRDLAPSTFQLSNFPTFEPSVRQPRPRHSDRSEAERRNLAVPAHGQTAGLTFSGLDGTLAFKWICTLSIGNPIVSGRGLVYALLLHQPCGDPPTSHPPPASWWALEGKPAAQSYSQYQPSTNGDIR